MADININGNCCTQKKEKEEEKPVGNLLNGWYKCTESNEKSNGGNYAWIEGRYYYFKDGYTTDEQGVKRPECILYDRDTDLWLKYCYLIPAAWTNGCSVKLKDGRTGKITIYEGEMLEVQLDSAYDIQSFVKVTPNEFEVIDLDRAIQILKQLAERARLANEYMHRFGEVMMDLKPFKLFDIPEVGMHIRDKKTLKVWRVEEVKLPECCCEENTCHGGYAELKLMTTTPANESVYCSCSSEPVTFTANTMCHETDLEHFWDNYEEYEDLGWSGMYFDQVCNFGKGKIITVYNGQIDPGSYDDGRRFKSFEEIQSHIPNIIKVDSMTYCEQEDPAKNWFTGYAICVSDGREDPEYPWCYPITVGKIYRMEKGRFMDDRNKLTNCTPEEFNECFKPVNESFT